MVFRSTNYGVNWTQVNNGLTDNIVASFAVSGTNIFAGSSNGLFCSTDYGMNWKQINPTDGPIYSIATNDTYIYASTFGEGIWKLLLADLSLPVELSAFNCYILGNNVLLNWSTQTEKNSDKFNIERKTIGAAWESIGSIKAAVLSNSPKQYSFADKNLQSGKYQYRLKMIDNDGTFEYSKTIESEVAVPKNYELSQNYPNRWNPSTTINYSLAKAGNVKLTVYNAIGSKVATIVNEYKQAGNYSVQFNGSNLSSGIYLYRLESGNYSAAKKFILLK